ncbi:MAG: sulfur oxidation c-type cytochrome SoxA [Gammaproteobacteria bacterium]
MKRMLRILGACLLTALGGATLAEQTTEEAIAEYHDMFGDENPAELWELRGQELWTQKRGPKNADLTACDLGRGPGVIEGAYAALPRWFEDTGRVQDLETRLVTCMTTVQGFTEDEVLKVKFGDGAKKSDLEALVAYVVKASKGHPLTIPMTHPAEQRAYALGHGVFYYRAGPHDFACATCHGDEGKRIRLQALPKLTEPAGAREAYTRWPAYRVSQGELRTMEWRLQDCFRQQRLPQLKFGSDVAIGLTMFLAKTAEGGEMAAPSIKR